MENKKNIKRSLSGKKGFAALYIAIVVLIIMLGIAMSLAFLVVNQQKIIGNSLTSYKSFSAAEAGIEDALLRLTKGMNLPSSYTLTLGSGTFNVVILSDIIEGTKTITSTGNVNSRIRKVQVVCRISTTDLSFHYGIQVGDLGLQMNGNAVVHGNIFSNGPITGDSNTKIYGDAISAGPSGLINTMNIKDDEGGGSAWAATITGGNKCVIDGDAHYTTSIDCDTVGGSISPGTPVTPQDMPITQDEIDDWQKEAEDGGTPIAGYSLGGNDEDSLGPIKVDGDMSLDSNAELTVTGTIWVTGDLSLTSNVKVQLDSGYGILSGVIVVEGQIFVDSNVVLCGSEGFKEAVKECYPSTGSYLMLLSTYPSVFSANPAISAKSNTETAVLYASAGFVSLDSSAALKEATGLGIYMASNAEVTYETGLVDARFGSGPGGGWQVASWKEIE